MAHLTRLSGAQNHRCCYCQHRMTDSPGRNHPVSTTITKDHVIPFSYGGPTEPGNLVAACLQCNSLRGNLDATLFAYLMRKWFARDQTLQARWHDLDKPALRRLRHEVACYQALHLKTKQHEDAVWAARWEHFCHHAAHKLPLNPARFIASFI